MPEHFWHQPDPSGAQDVIPTPRNLPSQHSQSQLERAKGGGVCIVTWWHTGNWFAPPKVKRSTRSTWSLPLSSRWHCFGFQASVQCWWPAPYPSLTCCPTRKEWKEKDMPIDLCQQKLNLWPPSLHQHHPPISFPLAHNEHRAPYSNVSTRLAFSFTGKENNKKLKLFKWGF